jgi:hypothetical protein
VVVLLQLAQIAVADHAREREDDEFLGQSGDRPAGGSRPNAWPSSTAESSIIATAWL